jgi:hypothetical protein
MANGSTTKVIPIVLGILGAMVTAVSLTYGITQGRASEKVETIKTEFTTLKTDYEEFRRDDAKLKGMIIERLDTTVSLLKSHMGGPQ